MMQNICNICGANYEYRNGRWKCPACGAYKPEELSNEEQTLLYIAEQKRRLACFEEAEQEYSDIIEKYPQNPYGYWGRLLSKHGIKYERDYDGKMIPTCCSPTIDSLLTDKDCLKAINLADEDTKQYFQIQSELIERIRNVWVNKANKEKPYDIFICYKDSDLGNGIERTQDSIEAQEIYLHLISQGYRVFYSRESLRDKVGEKYEPYIFNALSTAKVMLVYGKSAEYITSTWLKNEWTRFLKMMKNGLKKPDSLIVAYEGFSPSELPTTLSAIQCLDASRKTFYTDLDKIVKVAITSESKQKKTESNATKSTNTNGALVCPDCGGNFSAADLLDGDSLVTCLACGKTYYTADIMRKTSSSDAESSRFNNLTPQEKQLLQRQEEITRNYLALRNEKQIEKDVKSKYTLLLWIGIFTIFYYVGIFLLIYRSSAIKKAIKKELANNQQILYDYNQLQNVLKKTTSSYFSKQTQYEQPRSNSTTHNTGMCKLSVIREVIGGLQGVIIDNFPIEMNLKNNMYKLKKGDKIDLKLPLGKHQLVFKGNSRKKKYEIDMNADKTICVSYTNMGGIFVGEREAVEASWYRN